MWTHLGERHHNYLCQEGLLMRIPLWMDTKAINTCIWRVWFKGWFQCNIINAKVSKLCWGVLTSFYDLLRNLEGFIVSCGLHLASKSRPGLPRKKENTQTTSVCNMYISQWENKGPWKPTWGLESALGSGKPLLPRLLYSLVVWYWASTVHLLSSISSPTTWAWLCGFQVSLYRRNELPQGPACIKDTLNDNKI